MSILKIDISNQFIHYTNAEERTLSISTKHVRVSTFEEECKRLEKAGKGNM